MYRAKDLDSSSRTLIEVMVFALSIHFQFPFITLSYFMSILVLPSSWTISIRALIAVSNPLVPDVES